MSYSGSFALAKCPQFDEEELWRTLRKMGSSWAKENATSQLHRSSRAKVKPSKQVPACVICGNISSACAKEYLIAATY